MTIGDKPILYIRVKKETSVKMRGARRNSYSSMVLRIEDRSYHWDNVLVWSSLMIMDRGIGTFRDFLSSVSSYDLVRLPLLPS